MAAGEGVGLLRRGKVAGNARRQPSLLLRLFFGFIGVALPVIIFGALSQVWELLHGRPTEPLAFAWLALFAAPVVIPVGLVWLFRVWKPVDVPPPPDFVAIREGVAVTTRPAQYPLIAQWRGQVGWVLVDISLDSEGRYLAHQVIEDAPPRLFRRAARRALKGYAVRCTDGSSSPPMVRTVVRFALGDEAPAALPE